MPHARRSALHRAAAEVAPIGGGRAPSPGRGRHGGRRRAAGRARGRRRGRGARAAPGRARSSPCSPRAGSPPSPAIASGSCSTPSRRSCTPATAGGAPAGRAHAARSERAATTASGRTWRSSPAISRLPSGCSNGPGSAAARTPARRDDRSAASVHGQPRACAARRPSNGRGARCRSPRTTPAWPCSPPRRWPTGSGSKAAIDEAHAVLDRWLEDRERTAARERLRPARVEGPPARGPRRDGGRRRAVPARLRGRAGRGPAGRGRDVAGRRGARPVPRRGLGRRGRSSAERAIAVAIESEDRWVIAHARWSAAFVASCARRPGDRRAPGARGRRRARRASSATRRCRHLVAAQLAAAQERPRRRARRPGAVAELDADFTVLALASPPGPRARRRRAPRGGRGLHRRGGRARAPRGATPLLAARLRHARARLAVARQAPEAAMDAFTRGPRARRAAADAVRAGADRTRPTRSSCAARASAAPPRSCCCRRAGRFAALGALPALRRCEQELTACGLRPAPRSAKDYAGLTPQETAVARLVVSGMTQPRGRQGADAEHEDRRVPPQQRLPQGRRALANRAPVTRARRRPPL